MERFQELDIHQAREFIEMENPVIVDIRDPISFSEAHIENAVSLNNENCKEFVESTDKHRPILCYCYHGITSQQACQFLKDNGFKLIYSMTGGFEAWREAYPTAS